MDATQLQAICDDALQIGRLKHGLSMGIVSHIYDGKYEVFAVDSETGIPQAGDIFDVQAVYCREVLETRQSVAITQVEDTPGMCLHPLYEIIPCEVYLSSPLLVNGSIWGTLNYTSFEIRKLPFTANDIAFNEKQAATIAAAIEQTDLCRQSSQDRLNPGQTKINAKF